ISSRHSLPANIEFACHTYRYRLLLLVKDVDLDIADRPAQYDHPAPRLPTLSSLQLAGKHTDRCLSRSIVIQDSATRLLPLPLPDPRGFGSLSSDHQPSLRHHLPPGPRRMQSP